VADLTPVDTDPFAASAQPNLVPVDHDPFAPDPHAGMSHHDPAMPASPRTTLSGLAASAGRGAAPEAVGALAGGAVGGPIGAAAGAGLIGVTQAATTVYNMVAPRLGWPRSATPQEMTDKVMDYFGIKRPQTGAERTAEAVGGGVASGIGIPAGAKVLSEAAAKPLTRAVAGRLSEQPARQAVAGGTGALGGQIAAEAGGGPTTQLGASLLTGGLPFMGPNRLPPTAQAERMVERRLAAGVKAGEITPEKVTEYLGKTRALGKPTTLLEAGGTNMKGLGGAVARQPGESRAVIEGRLNERDAGAGPRLKEDIARDLGQGPTARRTVQGLRQAQSAEGQPLYDRAYAGGSVAPLERQFEVAFDDASKAEKQAAGELTSAQTRLTAARAKQSQAGNVYLASAANEDIRNAEAAVSRAQRAVNGAQADKAMVLEKLRQTQGDAAANAPGAVWNPRIQQFLNDPTVRKGIGPGLQIQRLEALAKGERFDPTEYAIVGTDAAGEPVVGKVPNMRTLDAVKKGLDVLIQSNRDADGRLNQLGRAADQTRRAFLEEVDRINPDYKTARQTWAGTSASIDAVNLGRNISKMTPEEVSDAVSGMPPGDREFMQIGVADSLLKKIETTPFSADEAKRAINNEWTKGQLRPVFASEKAFNDFVESVAAERAMAETKAAVLANSPTATRLAESGALNSEAGAHAAQGAIHMATGRPMAAALSAWRTYRLLGFKPDPKMSAEIARLLTDPSLTPTQGPHGLTISPTGVPAGTPSLPFVARHLAPTVIPGLGNVVPPQGQQ
jgi:hypothetical protein